MAVEFRSLLFSLNILKSTDFEIPVISVGNITVGGTGKTPHTEYLINLLGKKYNVAVLSRGYKRRSKGYLDVLVESTSRQVGDEPLQMKRKFPDATVAVDEKRVRGIQRLLSNTDKRPDVVILDDAFQHRYVTPSINILLIDFSRMITEDKLLPLGSLREPASGRSRANIIIVTKCPQEIKPIEERLIIKDLHIWPYQDLYFTRFKYGNLIPVFPEKIVRKGVSLADKYSILLVTGIANPRPLAEYLQPIALNLSFAEFDDHHSFSSKDLEMVNKLYLDIEEKEKIIVTTEKDAVRLLGLTGIPEAIPENLYYLPITVEFLNQAENEFDKKLIKYVGENKSNFELHQRKNKL